MQLKNRFIAIVFLRLHLIDLFAVRYLSRFMHLFFVPPQHGRSIESALQTSPVNHLPTQGLIQPAGQSFGHDPCASLSAQLLFSTGARRASPVDVLWNYTQLVNSGPVSYFPTLTGTTRCFPGSISCCATIEVISIIVIAIWPGDRHLLLCDPSESDVSVCRGPSHETFLGRNYRLCRLVHISVVPFS